MPVTYLIRDANRFGTIRYEHYQLHTSPLGRIGGATFTASGVTRAALLALSILTS